MRSVTVGPGTPIELTIRVWAPSWMPIESVRLISNGEVLQTFAPTAAPVTTGARGGLWLEQQVSLQPTLDAWYAVEVEGKSDMAPILPGMTPWAMTAPVFLDADGSPGFTPPCRTHACP